MNLDKEIHVHVLHFDEDQKAKISAALTALVAEEAVNNVNNNKPLELEIIDLLSDSQDSTDCEIFDFDSENTVQLKPLEIHPEVKLEKKPLNVESLKCAQSAIPPEILAEMRAVVVDYEEERKCQSDTTRQKSGWAFSDISQETQGQFMEPIFSQNPIEHKNDERLLSEVGSLSTANINSIDEMMDTRMDSSDQENLLPQAATSEDTEIESEQSNSSECFVKAEVEERKYMPTIDEIIELGSDNDEMDEETEKKIISLIESDGEEDAAKTTPTSVGAKDLGQSLDMLIHYICPQCEYSCGSFKKWKLHVDIVHDFRSISKVLLHLERFIDRKGKVCFKCTKCKKIFDNRKVQFAKLIRHYISHLPFTKYYKCRLCDARRNNRRGIRYHLLHQHAKICLHYVTKITANWYSHLEIYCPSCNEQMTSRSNLQLHLEKVHRWTEENLLKKVKFIEENLYQCNACERRCNKLQLKTHTFSHEPYKAYRCKLCETYSTNSLSCCSRHIRIRHLNGGQRKYECFYCDEQLPTPRARHSHLRQQHNVKQLSCKECQKLFPKASMLLSHVIHSHHNLI